MSTHAGLARRSWGVGRVDGIDLDISWTWPPVLALALWTLARGVFPDLEPGLSPPADGALGVAGAVILCAAVALHELGHARRACREGLPVAGVTVWALGGAERFAGVFASPGAELRVALAGPLVSLAAALPALAVATFVPLGPVAGGLVAWVGFANLLVGGFGLLPALPLDGGRVVRALLWRATGDLARATSVGAALGGVLGAALIAAGGALALAGAAVAGLWLAGIGFLVIGGSRAEAGTVALRSALRGLHVRDVMTLPGPIPGEARPGPEVDADADLVTSLAAALQAGSTTALAVRRGRVVGVLDVLGVAHALRSGDWPNADQLSHPT